MDVSIFIKKNINVRSSEKEKKSGQQFLYFLILT